MHAGDATSATSPRTRSCTARAASRSAAGGSPPSSPCTTAAHSEPPNSAAVSGRRARSCSPSRRHGARRRRLELVDQTHDADDRRGVDVAAARLVVEADVAADDGRSSARHASLMPSTTSENCHITSGCSGLPKFRQFTSATRLGARARDVARGLEHHEPRRRYAGRGGRTGALPSVASASARGVPLSRRTVASPPGPTTVLRNSWWSYWRQTHDLSAIVGVASSASSSARGRCRRRTARAARARDRRRAARPGRRAAASGRSYTGPSPRLPHGTSAIASVGRPPVARRTGRRTRGSGRCR